MGEIAEAVLEGAFCEGCGVYLGEGDGFPRRCSACGGTHASDFESIKNEICPICKKKFYKRIGVVDHIRGNHAKKVNELITEYLSKEIT